MSDYELHDNEAEGVDTDGLDDVTLESGDPYEVGEQDATPMGEPDVADVADDAAIFYTTRESLEALGVGPVDDVEPALKRLGPPPFVRKGFPFLGLLATIYDHVAQRVENEGKPRSGMSDDKKEAGDASAGSE
ncbi:MAG: hypothetical protein KDA33_03055 [Phycisphaerales bacterium]|nr:hypothetical protein [Phycisphaerales bacterium]